MNDAAELLQTIYEHIRRVAGDAGIAVDVDSVFGLAVREAVQCGRCQRTTQQSSYTQFFFNTQVCWSFVLWHQVCYGSYVNVIGRN
jgi:hypothetical protein